MKASTHRYNDAGQAAMNQILGLVAGYVIVANSTMQVILVNIYTGTIEQRCDVIRTRDCTLETYELDPDAAYTLYGSMQDSLDPIHYAFNLSLTGW